MLKEMNNLVNELNKCSYEYYSLGKSSISDREYDQKYNQLQSLEKELNTILPNSPTQRIGDIVLDKFEKHNHLFKCYSMDKAQTYDELLEWDKKNKLFVKQNNLPKIQYAVMKKFDGLTINNTYKKYLSSSATRGTGDRGELVTAQVKTIKSIPLKIDCDDLIEAHGEALMTKNVFEEYNRNAEVPLKNLRNGAAGAIKNLNVKETAKRKLSAFFYDIGYSENTKFETYMDMMAFIEKMGLPVDKEYYLCNTIEEVKERINLIEKLRPNLNYEIDGAIVSINDIKTRELMGYTIKFPRWAIAYKYEAEETTTEILDVEFNTGRTGKVTPRAIVEPVDLMGATVSYATLNSMDDIKRKGVRIGSTVFIRRSNDVIPEILGVVEDSVTDDMPEIQMPKYCQSCGSELVQDGVHYFCRNSSNCKAQIVKSIASFGSINAMNIDGFSEKTAELLYENGIIKSVVDLFKLEDKKSKIINLPKFGINKYNNLIEAINNAKNVSFNQFIYALGIDGIGKKSASDLAKHFNNDIQAFLKATASHHNFTGIADFGMITAYAVYEYFQNESNMAMVNELLQYITIKQEGKKVEGFKDLSGLIFVVTGNVTTFKNRGELETLITSLNGKLSGSVSSKTNYLINNDITSTSGKNQKANELNIPIISETTFNEMIGR